MKTTEKERINTFKDTKTNKHINSELNILLLQNFWKHTINKHIIDHNGLNLLNKDIPK